MDQSKGEFFQKLFTHLTYVDALYFFTLTVS